jgi:hypothetical protein
MFKKLKILRFAFPLMLLFFISNSSWGNSADEERILRVGSCFCDGQSNCREKRNGNACNERDRCSALACVQIVGVVVATGAVLLGE